MMNRRNFISTTSLAGSAAFVGAGSLDILGVHLLNAKILLEKEEFLHLKDFAEEYQASIKTHPRRPIFINKIYSVDKLIKREVNKKGYETVLQNSAGEYLILLKNGENKFVKILKEI